MIQKTTQLSLPSRLETVERVAAVANDIAARCGFDTDAIFGIELAVREAVSNAVLHGNREDETKPVEISFTDSGASLTIIIRDHGAGFDPDEVPDPTREENLLNPSGRGLLFIRTFMDEVAWTRHPGGGMVVRMVKRLPR